MPDPTAPNTGAATAPSDMRNISTLLFLSQQQQQQQQSLTASRLLRESSLPIQQQTNVPNVHLDCMRLSASGIRRLPIQSQNGENHITEQASEINTRIAQQQAYSRSASRRSFRPPTPPHARTRTTRQQIGANDTNIGDNSSSQRFHFHPYNLQRVASASSTRDLAYIQQRQQQRAELVLLQSSDSSALLSQQSPSRAALYNQEIQRLGGGGRRRNSSNVAVGVLGETQLRFARCNPQMTANGTIASGDSNPQSQLQQPQAISLGGGVGRYRISCPYIRNNSQAQSQQSQLLQIPAPTTTAAASALRRASASVGIGILPVPPSLFTPYSQSVMSPSVRRGRTPVPPVPIMTMAMMPAPNRSCAVGTRSFQFRPTPMMESDLESEIDLECSSQGSNGVVVTDDTDNSTSTPIQMANNLNTSSIVSSGGTRDQLHNICAMRVYRDKSPEELRMEDYILGNHRRSDESTDDDENRSTTTSPTPESTPEEQQLAAHIQRSSSEEEPETRNNNEQDSSQPKQTTGTNSVAKLQESSSSTKAAAAAALSLALTMSKKEKEEKEHQLRCVICLSSKKSLLFLPCAHMCTCDDCGLDNEMVKCPICRSMILQKKKVFW